MVVLNRLARGAEPSKFHLMMKKAEEDGKLLGVFTQNVDLLELKMKLSPVIYS